MRFGGTTGLLDQYPFWQTPDRRVIVVVLSSYRLEIRGWFRHPLRKLFARLPLRLLWRQKARRWRRFEKAAARRRGSDGIEPAPASSGRSIISGWPPRSISAGMAK